MADEVVQAKIDALRDLVSVQFSEREKLHNAALDSLSKQIDTLHTANSDGEKSIEARMDRLTDRVTTIESTATGHSQSWGIIMAIVGLIFSGMVAFGIYAAR